MIYQFSLIFHFLVILFCLGCFILGMVWWRKTKKVSEQWKFFTIGFLFISLSEVIDLFAPIYKQQWGAINFYTEVIQGFGTALLFFGIIAFLRKRMEALKRRP